MLLKNKVAIVTGGTKGMGRSIAATFAQDGYSTVPMKRVGKLEEIAGAVLFLSSDLSSFITGETIKMAGGLPLKPEDQNLG